MFRYAFEYLSESEFEDLIVAICQNVLGISAHAFTSGRDGGRDSSFSGTAANYPNAKHPWSGNFIIQAKHVKDPNESCSDGAFYPNNSGIIVKEVAKIKKRKQTEQIDCYIIFTNRKLTGGVHPQIVQYMTNELGISNVDVHGVEDLHKYVIRYPQLVKNFNLVRHLLPDQFYEQDIRDVIVLFGKNTNWATVDPIANEDKIEYIDKELKNALNNVDDAYFKDIKDYSLKYFRDIDRFLHDPINSEYLVMYLNTIADLRAYILRNEASYTFVQLLESIIEQIVGVDCKQDIHKVRALVRVFVHFMYWNCDIGKK